MSRLAFALPLACLAAVLPAHAGFDSGNRLYEDCRASNYFNRGYCGGYVIGVVDAVERSGSGPRICVPEGATKGQLADVVLKYLEDHPERRNRDAGELVPEALHAAFPCGAAN